MNFSPAPRCAPGPAIAQWVSQDSAISDPLTLDAATSLLIRLYELRQHSLSIEIRRLHKLLNFPQTAILRSIRFLSESPFLIVSENLHDPLGAHVSLTDETIARLDRMAPLF